MINKSRNFSKIVPVLLSASVDRTRTRLARENYGFCATTARNIELWQCHQQSIHLKISCYTKCATHIFHWWSKLVVQHWLFIIWHSWELFVCSWLHLSSTLYKKNCSKTMAYFNVILTPYTDPPLTIQTCFECNNYI